MSTDTKGSTPGRAGERATAFSLDVDEQGVRGAFESWLFRLRTGNPGALPSVIGLIVLAIIFRQVSDRFLSAFNIGNIPGQGAYIAVIALGLVFVLLLGEIDLAAGTSGGTCAAIAAQAVFAGKLHGALPNALYFSLIGGMAIALALGIWLKAWTGSAVVLLGLILILTNLSQHLFLALVLAVCIGAAMGIFNGFLVAKVGIPSFVATLALFLAWQGVLQFALAAQPINTSNFALWHNLTYGNLSPLWSWVFIVVVVGGYIAYTVLRSIRAKRADLAHETLGLVLARGGILAVVAVVITALAVRNRNTNVYRIIEGIPVPAVIVIVLMIACTIALSKTTWGRHLYATGGNAEAARRAGIDVVHIKVTGFTLCSAFGALGGLMLASSQSSASLDLGSGNVLLFAVAAAVIGGTSLFGGRGKPRDAILGALVITIIPNGLGLRPSIDPQWQAVITGVVLLIAAAIDAVSRRRAVRS